MLFALLLLMHLKSKTESLDELCERVANGCERLVKVKGSRLINEHCEKNVNDDKWHLFDLVRPPVYDSPSTQRTNFIITNRYNGRIMKLETYDPYSRMSVTQLKKELERRDIKVCSTMKKGELQNLLHESDDNTKIA